ncbi:glucose dehydrogenase, putative [Pediculus humanus corporis]|uniref:Glucose dehydrogenase, putative n=1 Tax=Pediculus humanus subsp. corporis TaxID=121224 RepID=E0VXG8_PEDHC|nr:glucose dehydrogenase, putative [Pediculus humanus corporis]EEB18074.1 glucose dehydrogenase, putative [Pediculus humanus corporis]
MFDLLHIGGGSAGSIIAGRLSDNLNDATILLIEAGGHGYDIFNIPFLGPLKQMSSIDWQYTTIPQKNSCFALENNVSKWPSGKILGGSTHLNYMIHLEGDVNDYKSWKDPHSNDWDENDINYYFTKSKKCFSNRQCKFKIDKGSVNVRNSIHSTKLSDAILDAAKELGYSLNDLNSKTSTGFMKPFLNINEMGMRWTSDQYLKGVMTKRKNVKILTHAIVEKILLLNNYEAYGVSVRTICGQSLTIHANLEIIVSAGTIGSPKLLMLSGIGPKNSLHESNISSKVDLPVGKNLKDHLTTGLDLVILDKHLFSYVDLMLPSSAYEFFARGKGPFTSGLVDVVGVVRSSLMGKFDGKNTSPDLEFMVMMAGVSSDQGVFMRKSMGISQKVWENYFKFFTNESVVSILPVLLHPKSVGEMNLNPNDPNGMPLIDPKYLSHENDVFTLVEGIRTIRKITKTKSLADFGVRFNDKKFPGCENWKFDSDEYWRCYVKHLTLTVYHPVGTCKMSEMGIDGVVDYNLRVHKTNKLRVIDASIMPTLPSSNPNAVVIMIAEKGSDMIIENHNNRFSSCSIRDMFITPKVCQIRRMSTTI